MADPIVDALSEEIDELARVYATMFAGQRRTTRDGAAFDDLIRRGDELVARLDGSPAAPETGILRLRRIAKENQKLFTTEREAVEEAKRIGPDYDRFARHASHADAISAAYTRHFGNMPHATRDPAFLEELTRQLERVQQAMQAIAKRHPTSPLVADADQLSITINMYRAEHATIVGVQEGGTDEARAGLLAFLADQQLRMYAFLFRGRRRVTRRPALLRRIIDRLGVLFSKMVELEKKGVDTASHKENIALVEKTRRFYETELVEIRRERKAAGDQLVGNLGDDANQIFRAYDENISGRDRLKVDLDLLVDMTGELGELLQQMAEIAFERKDEQNERNLDIVLARCLLFHREANAIVAARQGR